MTPSDLVRFRSAGACAATDLRTTRVLIFVVVSSVLYYLSTTETIPLTMSIEKPAWWLPSSSKFLSIFSWLQASHWLGVIAASLPFAGAIRAFGLKPALPLAFSVSVLGLVLPIVVPDVLRLVMSAAAHTQGSAALDSLKFLFTLPLLTLLFSPRRGLTGRSDEPPAAAVELVVD